MLECYYQMHNSSVTIRSRTWLWVILFTTISLFECLSFFTFHLRLWRVKSEGKKGLIEFMMWMITGMGRRGSGIKVYMLVDRGTGKSLPCSLCLMAGERDYSCGSSMQTLFRATHVCSHFSWRMYFQSQQAPVHLHVCQDWWSLPYIGWSKWQEDPSILQLQYGRVCRNT